MGFMNESLTVQDQDEDISSEIKESHPENRSHRQVSSHLTSASKKRDTSHENLKVKIINKYKIYKAYKDKIINEK